MCANILLRYNNKSILQVHAHKHTYASTTNIMLSSMSSLEQLRLYVTDESSNSMNQSEHTCRLFVTHSNLREMQFLEIRFDLRWTIRTLKEKLMTHCGTNASAMRLQLLDDVGRTATNNDNNVHRSSVFSGDGNSSSKNSQQQQQQQFQNYDSKSQQNGITTIELSNDEAKLGYYSPSDGMRLHVIDTDPTSLSANGWLEDVSKVEKYVMSDEAYEKREGTYRQWARKKREEDPTWTLQKEQQKLRNQQRNTTTINNNVDNSDDAIAAAREKMLTTYASYECVRHVVSGSRCEVNPGGKRGVVCFIGKVKDTTQTGAKEEEEKKEGEEKHDVEEVADKDVVDMPPSLPSGYWVGVKFDEPVGKNDGKTPCGKILIPECPPMHGSFCRPDRVTCGEEFTEIDEFASSSEDEEI